MSTYTIPEWTLGDRLAKVRSDAGLTTYELADLLGVSRTTVTNWENDTTRPKRYAIEAWARFCNNTDPEWLVGVPTITEARRRHPRQGRRGPAHNTTSDLPKRENPGIYVMRAKAS
jgi:transcriptional regulator with XRE-family HTH domain